MAWKNGHPPDDYENWLRCIEGWPFRMAVRSFVRSKLKALFCLLLLLTACGPAVNASGPTLPKHTMTPLPMMEGVELTGVFRDMKWDQNEDKAEAEKVWKVQLCCGLNRTECYHILAVEVENPKRPSFCVATPLEDRPDLYRVFCYK